MRLTVTVSVSPDLVPRLDARAILKALLPLVNGRGGGNAYLAEGGGYIHIPENNPPTGLDRL